MKIKPEHLQNLDTLCKELNEALDAGKEDVTNELYQYKGALKYLFGDKYELFAHIMQYHSQADIMELFWDGTMKTTTFMAVNHNGTQLMKLPKCRTLAEREAEQYSEMTGNATNIKEMV